MAQRHPAQFSPEVLAELEPLIERGEHAHDPFAGPGLRLARLCDERSAIFTGTDIEAWPGADPRVRVGDARDPLTYPPAPFTVVTSPVYANKRLADYPNGPTINTKIKGRRDYALDLGQALHADNLARLSGRPGKTGDYYREHAQAVKHWGERVLLNVDHPIAARWQAVLVEAGYGIEQVIPAYTRRYGGLHNADKRAAYEVVIIAQRRSARSGSPESGSSDSKR